MKKRSDGRYVKVITDPKTKKRISFYGKSAREVNQKILDYESKLESGKTFSEVANEWWEEAEPDLAIQSLPTYRPALARAIEHFGDFLIKDITPREITRFIKSLSNEGYAQKTLSNQRLVLNRIFKHAVIEGDIAFNPCADVEIPANAKKTLRGAATASDEDKIKNTDDTWLFPLIAIYTGLRKGEILALTWQDIDFDEDLITVTKSVAHDGDKPYVKEPKTEAGTRLVPLLLPLKKKLLSITHRTSENYIISDTGKTPLTKSRFETLYNHYQKNVGITATAHQLRHSFATIAIENGVDIKAVSEILGHKQISTTLDIYTDFRKKALESSRKILNSAFLSSK
jgi:integrase